MFVLAYNDTAGDNNRVSINFHQNCFLPRVSIENYNTEIDGRNFNDQPINDLIKQYNEVRKVLTGSTLDFAYFEKSYRLIAADLSEQKASPADSRTVQQITFNGIVKSTAVIYYIYYILEQLKKTILQFSKGTAKAL